MTRSITAADSVFLTGATGFLGGHLRVRLAEIGCDVTLLARSPGTVSPRDNESIEPGSLLELTASALDGHEYVFHLAAQTSIGRAIDSPRETWDTNATGALHVLDAARDGGIERVLYASSASVYGPPAYLPIDESHPLDPVEPYGASKLAGDRLARAFHRTYDLPVVIVRPFNVFGPGQPTHNVVPTIITQALSSDTVELGNTTPSRDFTYVEDAIEGVVTAFEAGVPGETYNIGRGEGVEIGRLAETILELVDTAADVSSVAERQRDSGVEIPRHVADATKLEALGWAPDHGFEAALRETIESYKE